ncbi:ribosome biogenesis protein BMS1 homolog isoform X2 [Contarinia nasturtii]|uniref:ribosome biogenesis protein BMS1 homolog isoform X2 n=1 Tax=Contarinia nasturtii TaxID=265458 RepID=UPI0012D3B967|nr:ribosome biogenesis protein BMS1 homolog isoform X2 [Contarinia nasturtii]
MADIESDKKKEHRKKQSGVSAEKKKAKTKQKDETLTARQRNPKAFAIQSVVRAERNFRRGEDLTAKKQHIPLVDKSSNDVPPILIAVVGPPKVGKSTLINNLIRSFTRTNVTNIEGPITIVTSKKRRITLIECKNDINAMIDIAKCADLVLLMIDASFGFEMEIFEFLNICQVHGMPKIMGILTHLDAIKNAKTLKRRKKELKHRFWTEVFDGAKLFYLSGILHGEYLRNEVKNLSRFISVMKFRPLTWRGTHSYILADRMEDVTNTEEIRLNAKCNREVILYGYVRGVPMTKENMVHIAGLGDMRVHEMSTLPDPCPLPTGEKKRNLMEKERLLYAPMSGVGGIVYDKDAVYIELQGSHSHKKEANTEQEEIVQDLIGKKETFDTQIDSQEFRLFSDGALIKSKEFQDNNKIDSDDDNDSESDADSDEDSGVDEEDSEAEQNGLGWQGESDDEEDPDENDSSDDDEYQFSDKLDKDRTDDVNERDEDIDEEMDAVESGINWRDNLAQKARFAYLERQSNSQNLMKIVYGAINAEKRKVQQGDENDSDEEDKIGGMFNVVANKQADLHSEKENRDAFESCFFEEYGADTRDWSIDENKHLIKDCFVTGKWRESEDAQELLRLDDLSDDDSEIYGDFEDLETGEKHKGKKNVKAQADDDNESDDDDDADKLPENEQSRKRKMTRVEESNLTKTELMAKKMKLKAQFDSEYDNKDDGRIKGDHQYYEELKAAANRQSELNKKEFENLDDDLRVQIEGFRSGLYVRLAFKNVPCEFVENFDATYPILIGGLNMSEENVGYVNCKVKKHRWYKKLLKTTDPLILSLGWRRFQTIPIFAKVEDDMKHRYLKYTPNHVTCSMTFYGPITPQNTGFLAIQKIQQNTDQMRRIGFRIAATGCVTEVDKSTQIMKKLKLVGTPFKIFKKSAFIKGMFNSNLEVAKFEGAKIKTVSGIRGQIKKANQTPEGSYRATFEDKILLSDIVFCRTWFKVDVPKFYAPVTNLMLPPSEKNQWIGMKTVGELKREKNIKAKPNSDSLYTKIVRPPKQFYPLHIPRALQKSLPYKDRPKLGPVDPKKPIDSNRIAVIHSPHEQRVANMMKMIKTNFDAKKEKTKKETEMRVKKFKDAKLADEMRRLKRQKELRKKICRTISRMETSKAAGKDGGGGKRKHFKK